MTQAMQAALPIALPITQIITENGYNKTFVLDGKLDAQPGQFVMAWLPGFEDKPFSLSNADPISLTIAAVGPFSRAVHKLQVGDYLWIRGPLGAAYRLPPSEEPNQSLLFIGGGYGVAPLYFLAKQALPLGHEVAMIIGARSQKDLLLTAAFEQLGAKLWVTTEDGSEGQRGLVTDAITSVLQNLNQKPWAVYSCGPTGMLEAVCRRFATELIPVQLGWEAHMRCGIGLCGSCEVGAGWLTCLDGPVFSFNPRSVNPADPT